MFKFVILCAAVAVARAGYLSSAAPSISYSSYAAVRALRYAVAAPALGYSAAAPALSYDTDYSRAIHAAPAVDYAAPALDLQSTTSVSYSHIIHPTPAVEYVSFAASAIHAAPLVATAVVQEQPSILRSFGSHAGYAAPAITAAPVVHTSYPGDSLGYATAPVYIGYHSQAAAAPLFYGRAGYPGVGYACGHGLGYAAVAPPRLSGK